MYASSCMNAASQTTESVAPACVSVALRFAAPVFQTPTCMAPCDVATRVLSDRIFTPYRTYICVVDQSEKCRGKHARAPPQQQP